MHCPSTPFVDLGTVQGTQFKVHLPNQSSANKLYPAKFTGIKVERARLAGAVMY